MTKLLKCSNCDIAGEVLYAETAPAGWWIYPYEDIVACSEDCVDALDAVPRQHRKHGFRQTEGKGARRFRMVEVICERDRG